MENGQGLLLKHGGSLAVESGGDCVKVAEAGKQAGNGESCCLEEGADVKRDWN